MLSITLRPHIERAGYHTDRFDAYLGDELISTNRSGWHAPARALLRRGYPPDTLMRVHHAGTVFDLTIVPKPIGEIAKWSIHDTDRDGLHRVRWQPKPDDPLATLYPHLWIEPSVWPWDASPSTSLPSPAAAEVEAA